MNKTAVVREIIAHLKDKVAQYHGAAKAAHAEATHEESRQEDKYDTRGLEASYLAAGQARQMEETAEALQMFASMVIPKFGPKDKIDIGALVELKSKEGNALYFIGPQAGGTEIVLRQQTILVITPQSPLGQQITGKAQGDKVRLRLAGRQTDYVIATVA